MTAGRATSTNGSEVIAKNIDIGGGFQLGEVSVPCSALTFVGAGHASEEAHRGVRRPRLRPVSCAQSCATFSTPETLDFYTLPDDDAPVRLTGSTLVSELERRGEWSRVATLDDVHMDGAQLTGWVRNAGLEELSGSFAFTGGRGLGPARIDLATPVYSSAGNGHRWATVRDGAAEFEVTFRSGEAWAQIRRAPHISFLQGAWVRVEAVHPIRI